MTARPARFRLIGPPVASAATLLGAVCALAAAAAVLPADAAAQARTCVIQPEPEPREVRQIAGPGGRPMRFISGPFRVICGGDVTIAGDSAMTTGTGELRIIGNVFYEDSTQTLTSDFANYFADAGRLFARGNVIVRDRATPSVVSGAELEYERVTPERPETRVVVRGRPRAFLYEEGTPPLPEGLEPSPRQRVLGGDTIPGALQIDADRLELMGESRMLAQGRVQMVQEDMRAFGDAVDYDRGAGDLHLIGNARVEGEGYELFGDRVDAGLAADQLESVVATGQAALLAEEIEVYGSTIRAFLSEGEVERLVAVAPPALPAGAPTAQRARAFAEEFTMLADSIEAIAPGQVVERVVAVGDAYAERRVDSLAVGAPELIARDWVRGDTIVGTFVQARAPRRAEAEAQAEVQASDSVETQLEQLIAVAGEEPARSLYRMASEDPDVERPAVNFLVAQRITLDFEEGEVGEVAAVGPIRGVHLEPGTAEGTPPASVLPAADGEPAPDEAEQGGAS